MTNWAVESGFCERLKQARINSHHAQVHVACALETNVWYISEVEQGHVVPSIKRAAELADLYGVSLDWLCGLKGGNDDD